MNIHDLIKSIYADKSANNYATIYGDTAGRMIAPPEGMNEQEYTKLIDTYLTAAHKLDEAATRLVNARYPQKGNAVTLSKDAQELADAIGVAIDDTQAVIDRFDRIVAPQNSKIDHAGICKTITETLTDAKAKINRTTGS